MKTLLKTLLITLVISTGCVPKGTVITPTADFDETGEYLVISDWCAGFGIEVDRDMRVGGIEIEQGDVIIHNIKCRVFNMTTLEYLSKTFPLEEVSVNEEMNFAVIGRESVARILEHKNVKFVP